MKKFLLNRVRQGQFDPSSEIQLTIDSLNKSYSRAKETVDKMHSEDEITFRESMTREFRYYSTSIQRAKLKQFEDEHKKMFQLKKELTDLFGVDVWDEVILNCEFDSLEEMYSSFKNYIRENYD
jgi:hypothetical protein